MELLKNKCSNALSSPYKSSTLHSAWPLPACQWIIDDLSDDRHHEHELGLCQRLLSSFHPRNYSTKYLKVFSNIFPKSLFFRRIWVAFFSKDTASCRPHVGYVFQLVSKTQAEKHEKLTRKGPGIRRERKRRRKKQVNECSGDVCLPVIIH